MYLIYLLLVQIQIVDIIRGISTRYPAILPSSDFPAQSAENKSENPDSPITELYIKKKKILCAINIAIKSKYNIDTFFITCPIYILTLFLQNYAQFFSATNFVDLMS